MHLHGPGNNVTMPHVLHKVEILYKFVSNSLLFRLKKVITKVRDGEC